MSWTEERVEQLKKLWSDGLSASRIAAEMGGVSRNAVIGKVHRLKLEGRAKLSTNTSPSLSNAKPSRARVKFSSKENNMAEDFIVSKEAPALEEVLLKKEEVEIEIFEKKSFKERRLTLLELSESTCKWPTGDPLAEDFYFCGADAEESSPYCKAHSKVAFQSLSDRRKKPV